MAAAVPAGPSSNHATAAVAEPLHPVGDTVRAVLVDGERVIACTECGTHLSGYGEDYKTGTVVRELAIADLSSLNAVAPATDLIVREFYCPGCGTAVALDIQRAGEALLDECRFADAD